MRRAAFQGLVLYIVLAGMDGALNYIPVMAFYWFAYMVYLFGWPGQPDGAPASRLPYIAGAPGRPASTEMMEA
jgi:hypothetical protein